MVKIIFNDYIVTDDGRVFSTKSGQKRELKGGYAGGAQRRKYTQVCLQVNDIEKQKSFYVHRLVAEAFIPNPDNLPQVNHIDGNPKNNHVSNLEWCTGSQNIKHAYDTGLWQKYVCKKCGQDFFGEREVCGICWQKEKSRNHSREKRKTKANAREYTKTKDKRAFAILSAYKQGEKQTEIAKKHRISKQRIHQIINHYKIEIS